MDFYPLKDSNKNVLLPMFQTTVTWKSGPLLWMEMETYPKT
mgnify:CR=1 FL=1